jgi:hypothetical protein
MTSINYSKLELRLGFGYMIAAVIVMNLAANVEATWTAAGISALLAWVILLMGTPSSNRAAVIGLITFLAGGALLAVAADWMASFPLLRVASVGAVAFLGGMLLLKGAFAFVTGWCLVFWFLFSPILSGSLGLGEVLEGHFWGSGSILAYVVVRYLASGRKTVLVATPAAEPPSIGFAVAYSLIVALTMMLTLGLGIRWMKADPTTISAAAFNILSPSARQTWTGAAERMVFGTTGICLGYYLGVWFPSPFINQIIIAGTSFLGLAFIRISFGPIIFAFMMISSFSWGEMENGLGNAIANEKIVGELVGVVVAGLAISALFALLTRRRKT